MVALRSRASPLVMLLGAIFFLSSHVLAISAVLGIDLGTEYIKAALVKPGIPLDIVLTKDSRRKETSAVAFKPSRGGAQEGQFPERLYGSDAMALSARFPGEVYPNLKTLLGLAIDDPMVQGYAARYPALQLQAHDPRGTAAFKSNAVTADQEAWLVEELLAMQLQSVQKNAELAAGGGTTVRSVVLTVPPFFTTDEKRAIQSAAELAGLKVLSLISDGLAVGLNYATSRVFPNINEGAKPEYHMVFDMGAGSTKASVMKFQSRNVKDIGKFNKTIQEVQLMGSGWDRTLGGDYLNTLIVNDMIAKFIDSKGAKKVSATETGIRGHGRAMAKLNKEAERVRHVLSANQKTSTSFEGLYEDVDFKYQLSRAEFEAMSEEHAQRVAVVIHEALKKSGLDIGDLDSVILHGGASRTPFVQKALEKVVGSPDKLRSNVNSDEAAVFGAGFRAAELSPSFRVKEIRVSEGSAYPIGMSWTSNGKDHTERIWSAVSPIGGPAKEYTFSEDKDFTATFWQQVGEDYKNVKAFTTKNLTATMASFKEAHPTCADQGPQFRIIAKLNGENGEVEIVRAAVECEVVVREGFVDGVKNLFGFGKKDQEPLKEGEEPKPVTDDNVQADKSSVAAESASVETADAESTGSSEELKPEAQKLEVASIPVEITVSNLGTPELTKDQLTKTKDRLKAFSLSDRARLAREEALNKLEGFTYKVRDLLEDEAFVAASTEAERTNLGTKSSATSEWLYEDGAEATKDELKAKLKELQDLASPIQKRTEESAKRPELLTQLKDTLNKTFGFLEVTRKSIVDYHKWHAEHPTESADASSSAKDAAETPVGEFEGLEDDAKAPTMEDVLEERGPVPPLYKLEDLVDLEKLSKSTDEWLKELEPKQDVLPSTADPVLLVKDMEAKLQKIEAASKELSLKSVKNFMNKSKKAEKEKKEKKKPKKADNKAHEKQNIKVGDHSFTAEELEEMINNMSEGDWEKVSEDFKREEAAKHKPKEAAGHDEL